MVTCRLMFVAAHRADNGFETENLNDKIKCRRYLHRSRLRLYGCIKSARPYLCRSATNDANDRT